MEVLLWCEAIRKWKYSCGALLFVLVIGGGQVIHRSHLTEAVVGSNV